MEQLFPAGNLIAVNFIADNKTTRYEK